MIFKSKMLSSICSYVKQESCYRRKCLFLFAISILALSVDIRCVNCDTKNKINFTASDGPIKKGKHGEDELSSLDLKFEKHSKRDLYYYLKNSNNVFMVQYPANSPIEDRCFIYEVPITDAEPLDATWNEDDEKKFCEQNDMEVSLVKNFGSSDDTMSECSTTDGSSLISLKKNEKMNLMHNIFDKKKEEVSNNLKNEENPKEDENKYLFAGVIDGHGGWFIAEIVKRYLGSYIKKELHKCRTDLINSECGADSSVSENQIVQSIENAYVNLDNAIRERVEKYFTSGQIRMASVGACCLTVLIDKHNYYVGNAGDSKGILGRSDGFVTLNTLHSANNVEERKKLIENHPNESDIVICKSYRDEYTNIKIPLINAVDPIDKLLDERYDHCYVKGRLQPTRNFGDFYLKYKTFAYDYARRKYLVRKPFSFPYVTAKPEIQKIKRSSNDEFIVLVSDGVSDFLSDEQIYNIVKENISHSVEKASKVLVKEVLQTAAKEAGMSFTDLLNVQPQFKRRLHDDTTVVIIKLN